MMYAALDIKVLRASHDVFHWIPAFAGMTSTGSAAVEDEALP